MSHGPTGPEEDWAETFPPEPGSLRRGRAGVEEELRRRGVGARVIDDALVVIAELMGNALRHAGTEFTVTVRIRPECVRLEVFDGDTRPPTLVGLDVDSTSGRGLHIVSAVATDWGWHTADNEAGVPGKTVWAELAWEGPGEG